MKNLGALMKQAQEMQEKMGEMQDRLTEIEVDGSSGAGLVQVKLSGKSEMRGIKIDPSLFNSEDAEVVEDLIIAAFGDAKAKSEAHMQEEMSKITGGLNLLIPGWPWPFRRLAAGCGPRRARRSSWCRSAAARCC